MYDYSANAQQLHNVRIVCRGLAYGMAKSGRFPMIDYNFGKVIAENPLKAFKIIIRLLKEFKKKESEGKYGD